MVKTSESPTSRTALNAAGTTAVERVLVDDGGDADQRKRDKALVAAAEAKLAGTANNDRLSVAARKAALREIVSNRRGIVYATLPAGDKVRGEIDAEVDKELDEIVAEHAKARQHAKLDAAIDNSKVARAKRLDAFFAETMLDKGVDLAKQSPDEQKNPALKEADRLAAYREMFRG